LYGGGEGKKKERKREEKRKEKKGKEGEGKKRKKKTRGKALKEITRLYVASRKERRVIGNSK
jgi:hypothetical protein